MSYIDNGEFYRKPFSSLYLVIGVVNLLFPIYILYQAIDNNIFDMEAKLSYFFVGMDYYRFCVLGKFSNLVGQKVESHHDIICKRRFYRNPCFFSLFQTFGEWIGIVGFSISLLAVIILGKQAAFFAKLIGISFL